MPSVQIHCRTDLDRMILRASTVYPELFVDIHHTTPFAVDSPVDIHSSLLASPSHFVTVYVSSGYPGCLSRFCPTQAYRCRISVHPEGVLWISSGYTVTFRTLFCSVYPAPIIWISTEHPVFFPATATTICP